MNLTPLPILAPVWGAQGDWKAILARVPRGELPMRERSGSIPWFACESRFIDADVPAVALPVGTGPGILRPSVVLPWSLGKLDVGLPTWRADTNDGTRLGEVTAGPADGLTGLFWRLPMPRAGMQHHRLVLMSLLDVLTQDRPDNEVIDVIRHDPNILYAILKLAQSLQLSHGVKISTVRDCLVRLGRKQLYRWVLLMLFSRNPGKVPLLDPQMLMAIYRARMMELLCGLAGGSLKALADEAFVAGVLTMLELVLLKPAAELLGQIPTGEATRALILSGDGPLHGIFRVVASLEETDFEAGMHAIDALGLAPDAVMDLQIDVMSWLADLKDGLYR
jgi:hypothetical protein